MLRKGELEPQGQVVVGCARGRAASSGAARELPGARSPAREAAPGGCRALRGRTRGGVAAGPQFPSVAGCETRDFLHGSSGQAERSGLARSFRDHSELRVMEGRAGAELSESPGNRLSLVALTRSERFREKGNRKRRRLTSSAHFPNVPAQTILAKSVEIRSEVLRRCLGAPPFPSRTPFSPPFFASSIEIH